MKYPEHTVSKPATGEDARNLVAAVDGGKTLANENTLATARQVAARWKRTARGQDDG